MKVKIGETIYDSESEPIMIILSSKEKKQISTMKKKDYKFCSYPDGMYVGLIHAFMEIEDE